MSAADPSFIFDTGCLILAAAEACLTNAGITLPDRRFVSACAPDLTCCDSLIVYPSNLSVSEDTQAQSGKCITRKIFGFQVVIARCVRVFEDGGDLPPLGSCADPATGTVHGDALNVMTDRWVLFTCLANSIKDTAGQGEPFCCQPVRILSVESLCSGGCAGSVFNLTLRM